ncbi:SCP2 sterol-binding domain-containing protein [Eubacterium oxidoreducens]|uniref:SCP-2 sterol transfer family protein n=1 Tax=Eubacterium oxidoreducens TaxID=1732 RepID=A0A1G6C877_EUBOX|nr:SCP2 sterol-binding domain-containing protein [Eubacterium oxidoreducens]SDB29095.1 SCP-2 sterol transfer family protein [Eubacterium oxidoreducens]
MTFEEIVEKITKVSTGLDAKKVKEHIAYEIDIIGEGHGAFYVELNKGKVDVQPYEYYDHDLKIVATADEIIAIFDGSSDPVAASQEGRIHVQGNPEDLVVIKELINAPAKKKTTKKSTTKKSETSKKATTKKSDTTEKKATTKKSDTTEKKATTTKKAATTTAKKASK